MRFKTISIIGLGYIGLPTAAMFASCKRKVIGLDINKTTVETINSGKIHIVEPGLDLMVKKAVDNGLLKATTTPVSADAFVIAVPTPFLPADSGNLIPKPDLQYIKSAAKAIAKVLKKGDLVILESTSPVGTTEKLASWLYEMRQDLTFPQTHGDSSDIRIAYCPERVLPGNIISELKINDRVVGGMTESCSICAIELYKIFLEGDCFSTNSKTAEMVKLTENASRDVGIAFANELSVICDKININVWELIRLANRHPRVNILEPGPGVGGHCIAVDPWFIASSYPKESRLIRAAREVNDNKPNWVINKIHSSISDYQVSNNNIKTEDINIIFYGLSFKPNIDDIRQSPSMNIVKNFSKNFKGKVYCVEPNIDSLPNELKKLAELIDIDLARKLVGVKVLLVDHNEFDFKEEGHIVDTKGKWG